MHAGRARDGKRLARELPQGILERLLHSGLHAASDCKVNLVHAFFLIDVRRCLSA
jgi:hypothetical protein